MLRDPVISLLLLFVITSIVGTIIKSILNYSSKKSSFIEGAREFVQLRLPERIRITIMVLIFAVIGFYFWKFGMDNGIIWGICAGTAVGLLTYLNEKETK